MGSSLLSTPFPFQYLRLHFLLWRLAWFDSQFIYQGIYLELSECPSMNRNNSMGTSVSFQFRNEQFSARSRKTRGCAEAYRGTSHKQTRSLTPRLRKRAIYGWKLVSRFHIPNISCIFEYGPVTGEFAHISSIQN